MKNALFTILAICLFATTTFADPWYYNSFNSVTDPGHPEHACDAFTAAGAEGFCESEGTTDEYLSINTVPATGGSPNEFYLQPDTLTYNSTEGWVMDRANTGHSETFVISPDDMPTGGIYGKIPDGESFYYEWEMKYGYTPCNRTRLFRAQSDESTWVGFEVNMRSSWDHGSDSGIYIVDDTTTSGTTSQYSEDEFPAGPPRRFSVEYIYDDVAETGTVEWKLTKLDGSETVVSSDSMELDLGDDTTAMRSAEFMGTTSDNCDGYDPYSGSDPNDVSIDNLCIGETEADCRDFLAHVQCDMYDTDGAVGQDDVNAAFACLNSSSGACSIYDLNDDGSVGLDDFNIINASKNGPCLNTL